MRKFNEAAASLPNTVVLAISRDLPFAQKRFCGAEGIENVVGLSAMKDSEFGKAYGVLITSGPLTGLFARSVVVVDEKGKVTYRELVPEIKEEPKYEAALSRGSLKRAVTAGCGKMHLQPARAAAFAEASAARRSLVRRRERSSSREALRRNRAGGRRREPGPRGGSPARRVGMFRRHLQAAGPSERVPRGTDAL